MSWDKLSDRQRGKLQDDLVREQVRAVVAAAPWWKRRFGELGRSASSVDGVRALAQLPAVGERDVSPTGDPAAMAGLVLHATEQHFTLHSSGPQLRRALRKRLTRASEYRRIVEAETKPTSYLWGGLGFRYPLASTRGDLDVVARAGARLWSVLGLSGDDALLSALPVRADVEHEALRLAALAAGAPALFPGDAADAVAAAAGLAAPTVIAAPSLSAPAVVDAVAQAGGLGRLTTLLLVGAPSDTEREAALDALLAAGRGEAAVLGVHAPAGARVLWGECRAGGRDTGLHTYPDLDAVQAVDADTGDPADAAGELVLTQLGLRGSALLRWRTADLVADLSSTPCPGCGRAVPRLVGVRRRALVVAVDGGRTIDLRAVTGALAGRPDVDDWRVVVGGRSRDGAGQVVVHLSASAEPSKVAVAVAADIRAASGVLPTQLVAAEGPPLEEIDGAPMTARVLIRR